MTPVSFTAVGNGRELHADIGMTVNYVVSGSFVATLRLDQFDGAGWVPMLTFTAPAIGSFTAVRLRKATARYRFSCHSYTSGTAFTRLVVVAPDVPPHQAGILLVDPEIKTLPTLPVQFVADVGAGRLLVPEEALFIYEFAGGAYTNIDAANSYLALSWIKSGVVQNDAMYVDINPGFPTVGLASFKIVQPQAEFSEDYSTSIGSPTFTTTDMEGSGLCLSGYNGLGDLTGGHVGNRLSVRITYRRLNLSAGVFE